MVDEKIKKLLLITEENGATENEAQIATAKITELLAKHNLSISEIKANDKRFNEIIENEVEVVMAKIYHNHILSLASIIAKYNFCNAYSKSRNGRAKNFEILFVGKEDNVKVCEKLFLYNYKTLKDQSNKRYSEQRKEFAKDVKHYDESLRRYYLKQFVKSTFIKSFYIGYIDRLDSILMCQNEKLKENHKFEIMVQTNEMEVAKYVVRKYPKIKNVKASSRHLYVDAYREGQNTASKYYKN